jgi:UrcA family protein
VPYTVGHATGAISVVSFPSRSVSPEESTMNKAIHSTLYTAVYCAFGAAVLCTLTSAAGAAEEDLPTKTVRFADLNVTNPAGAKVLYRRIQAAAREVCQLPTSTDKHLVAAEVACIDQAIDNAVKTVNVAALTNLRFGGEARLASK